jgi:hypothetical protein
MIINLSIPLSGYSKKDWISLAKVAAWLGGSFAVAWGVSYATKRWGDFYQLGVLFNVLGFALSRFFTAQEEQALSQLPSDLAVPAEQVVDQVVSSEPKAIDVTKTPAQGA